MDWKLLEELVDTFGVSGNEEAVRAILTREMKPLVDSLEVDKLGNFIALVNGDKPKVMLAAHMDEVGLMIKSIHEHGYVHVAAVGGLEPSALTGHVARIATSKGEIYGVITTESMSLAEEPEDLPKMDDLIVDTGLTKSQLHKLGVNIGSYVGVVGKPRWLGNEKMLSGKSLDNRIGCFMLVELAKRLKGKTDHEIAYVFTIQEEVGLYGATTSAYNIQPDWAIAIDTTACDDLAEHPSTRLGDGPIITAKDSDMIGNRCINNWLQDTAKKHAIPYQMEVTDAGTTDAINISISRGGVPSTVLAVGVRNIHSTISVAHADDIENGVLLLEKLMRKPPKVCLV